MDGGETRRIGLAVEYDGGAFFGWQVQPGHRTVQGEIEGVLARIFAAPARVIGSGRTDRGVHATMQVAAVDAPGRWEAAELKRALNALLPPDLRVVDARAVPARFHPRYDAVERVYVYRVGTTRAAGSPFHGRWCWAVKRPLDLQVIGAATATLPGEHSFRAFAKTGQEHRGDRCRITEAAWHEWPGLGVQLRIGANRFLHHMVRYLVGTLVEIGAGVRPASDLQRLLGNEKGLETSPPAPAEGLFLHAVRYPASAWGAAGPPPEPEERDLP